MANKPTGRLVRGCEVCGLTYTHPTDRPVCGDCMRAWSAGHEAAREKLMALLAGLDGCSCTVCYWVQRFLSGALAEGEKGTARASPDKGGTPE